MIIDVKGKAIPALTWTGPQGCRTFRFPDFIKSWHMKVSKLVSCTHRPP